MWLGNFFFRYFVSFAVLQSSEWKPFFFCYLCCLKVAVSAKVYRLFASLAARGVALALRQLPTSCCHIVLQHRCAPKIQRAAQLAYKQTRCRIPCVCVCLYGWGAVPLYSLRCHDPPHHRFRGAVCAQFLALSVLHNAILRRLATLCRTRTLICSRA